MKLLHSKDIPWLREGSVDKGVVENICEDSLKELAGTNRVTTKLFTAVERKKGGGGEGEPEKQDPVIRELPLNLPGPHSTSITPTGRSKSIKAHS